MSLGLVDDTAFEEELKRLENNSKPKVNNEVPCAEEIAKVIEPKSLGRPPGSENVPIEVKKVVAELAIEGAPSKLLQGTFGVDSNAVAAYKNGATSTATYNQPHPELNTHVLNTKQRIAKIATRKLRNALGAITDDKIKDLSPNKAAQLAKDMSAIVKDMTSDGDEGNKGVQVVFFSPRVNSKESYEVVVATE